MNHSLLSADRNTHLKIVSLALAAALAVVVIGITARVSDNASFAARFETGVPVLKAGGPVTYTRTEAPSVR
jgi:cytochrome oxidase Cu insertion factor (SCO1/SenC/PrrC family)